LGIASLFVLEGVPDRVRKKRNSFIWSVMLQSNAIGDFLFDAITAFAAVLETDQVAMWILTLYSAQCGSDLFPLSFYDTLALSFNPGVVGGFQDSVAFAVPGSWRVFGSVYWGALVRGPSAFVLGPHPAGEFGGLLPAAARLGLVAVLGLLARRLGGVGSLFCDGAEVVVTLLAEPGLGRGTVGRTLRALVWRPVGVIGTVDSHRTSRLHIETR
jgi:hypothetical protein